MEPTLFLGGRGTLTWRDDLSGDWIRVTSPQSPFTVTVQLGAEGRVVAALFERDGSTHLTSGALRRAAPGAFFRAAESWTGGAFASAPKKDVRAVRGSTPTDEDIVQAMAVLNEEESSEYRGAKRRAAERLHIDVATLYRWRRRFEARGLDRKEGR